MNFNEFNENDQVMILSGKDLPDYCYGWASPDMEDFVGEIVTLKNRLYDGKAHGWSTCEYGDNWAFDERRLKKVGDFDISSDFDERINGFFGM